MTTIDTVTAYSRIPLSEEATKKVEGKLDMDNKAERDQAGLEVFGNLCSLCPVCHLAMEEIKLKRAEKAEAALIAENEALKKEAKEAGIL